MQLSKALLLTLCSLSISGQPQAPENKVASAKPAAKKKGLPLDPTRTIEFTTDEGTWISLDVSPDGNAILFELMGHIYTLPVAGGEAKSITSGMAFDSQPRYSPDGGSIAFISDREGSDNLWVMKSDGSDPQQLSKDQQSHFASPSWTPDGQYVLVSRRSSSFNGFEIWMYHVRGGSGVQVTKRAATPTATAAQQSSALGVVASPDGRYFYYARRTGSSIPYNAMLPMWQIVRRDRKTGEEDVITAAPGSAMRPLLSPDGSKLIYGTRHETETGLRLRDLNTGEDRWLKYPIQRDEQEASAMNRDLLPGYAFLPHGREILLAYGGKIRRLDLESRQDRIVPFTAKVTRQLGPELKFPTRVPQEAVKARLIQAPDESPDGKRVAFSALTHLYVMDLPHGTPHRLTSGAAREFQPAWSPDGQWLAYVTWTSEGGQIWKARADGQSAPQQLTRTPAYYATPVWSPDQSTIVASRAPTRERLEGRMPDLELISVPATGGDVKTIVPARVGSRPHFCAEKDRIYLYSMSDGVISLRFDGTDRQKHIKVVGKSQGGPQPPPASEVRLSPDGQYALALVTNQLWLVAVPRIGGDAPVVNVSSPSTPVRRITDISADYIGWAENGKTIVWGLGSSFFRLPLSAVRFEPPKPPASTETAAEEKKDDKPKLPIQEIEISIEQPRHRPSGTLALRGVRAITMHGDEVIEDADIIVKDNRIAAIGRRGQVNIPEGARRMELKGTTVMPGIVDAHAHWIEIARGVLDTQSWPMLANLAYGVTTGRDPQTMTNDMFAYQDLIDMGEMLGPRAFSTGPGVFSSSDFQSLDDARNAVARYRKYYRTHLLKSYMVGNRKQRQWMVMACKELGIMPTTEGGLDLALDLTHAIDGFSGNEHALPVVPLFKDVVEIFARSGISYTPTLLVAYGGPFGENFFYEFGEVHNDPKLRRFTPHRELDQKTERRAYWFRQEQHIFPRIAAEAAKIDRAGGRVCVGGHGQLQGLQCHWEMWALKMGGMSNREVLRAATLHGAQAIGFDQDLGSLEPGKLADLLVLNKNPLDDIRNTNTIRYVMKDGELFEGDTLNQVWPREKKLAQLWWSTEDP